MSTNDLMSAEQLNDNPPINCLEGKVILVTGASGAIGSATSIALAEYGATVILLGRSIEKLEATYDEIISKGYPEPAIIPTDLASTSYQSLTHLNDIIGREFNQLDGVIFNASILGPIDTIENYAPERWDEVMQVNINSSFYLTQILLPWLKQAESASMIFTSSGVGKTGRAQWGAYSVSKFATEGLMQVLADEVKGLNIKVNSINPGATLSPMRQAAFPDEDPETLKKPEAVVNVYINLMNATNHNIRGQSIDFKAVS